MVKHLFNRCREMVGIMSMVMLFVTLNFSNAKAQWSEVGGTNTSTFSNFIYSLCTDAMGNLYAAGGITNNNGKNYIAKWSGNSWSEIGGSNTSTFNGDIYCLATDANGNLYAAGMFTNSKGKYYIAKWNGTTWSEIGGANTSTFNAYIKSITIDASGNLYASGGFFNYNNGNYNYYVAKWNGNTWSEVGGTNSSTFNGGIYNLTTDAYGNLYSAGAFTNSKGKYYVAKWNGTTWSEVGGTNNSTFCCSINIMSTDANGNLYIGGTFTNNKGKYYVAKWNGTIWSEVGGANNSTFNYQILSLATDAIGNLYAAGNFKNSNDYKYVAKWNGITWSEVGGANSSTFRGSIFSLTTDANANLYAGGMFPNDNDKQYVAKFINTLPTVSSFTPISARTSDIVSIRGINFNGATSVSFGGVSAQSFTVLNSTTIRAVVGSGSSGNVSITTNNGTSSLAGFTYITPTTWTGATNSNWGEASNWSTSVVPTSTDDVFIPSGKVVNLGIGSAAIKSLKIDANARLIFQVGDLTISDKLSGDGTIEDGSFLSYSILNIPSNSTIGTLGVNSNNFTISSGNLTISKSLYVYGGTLNTNNKLTLGSDASGSAAVTYPIVGTINGTVTVQNYIPQNQGSAFRDLGVPVFGATVADLSTQTYNYTNGAWSSQLPTGNAIYPGTGYRVQINTANNPVTLSYSGNLATNNVIPFITQGANAFSLIANPYQAVLSFDNITKSNIQNGFWYLDPTNLVNGYQGYVFWGSLTGASNTYSGALAINKYIQPGQAFFVQNTSGGGASSLTFTPSATVSGNQYQVFGTNTYNRISTGLFANGKNLDGAVVVFNNLFSNGNDSYDAAKFSNQGENLTFLLNGKNYCTNAWSKPASNDVLPLHLYNLKANTTYTLKLDASDFNGNGLSAYVKDNVLNTKTLLTGTNNEINFTTSSSNATSFSNRFSIVFGGTPLPVNEILVSAKKLANGKVSIDWNTLGENNVNTYTVESSENGSSFNGLATLKPNTSSRYNYVDAAETKAITRYYRIKAISINGEIVYSKVASIKLNEQVFSVYPNPVLSGESIKLTLPNTGKYSIQLFNQLGQKVYATTIEGNGTSAQNILNGKNLPTGNYELIATDASGNINRIKLMVK